MIIGKTKIISLWIVALGALSFAQTVPFADAKLKQSIEWKLGTSDPNTYDMLSLTELRASHQGISSLAGIEFAKNLRMLDLSGNEVSDIEELSELFNLEYINLGSNKVTDISPLSKLSKLTTLNLYTNFGVVDISPLSNLTHLKGLWLNFNKIQDISPLSNLTELEVLYISENQIKDISPIAGLVNLTLLYISNNNIKDISAISGMSKLEVLRLDENPINDLSIIKDLPNLTKFNNQDVEPGYDPSLDFPVIWILIWGVLGLLIFVYISILTKRVIRKQKVHPFRVMFQMFKWIFVVILSLVLLIGLYCQAPWKVLVLLSIILCTITIMPKPYRKWVWIGTVVLVVGLVTWVFMPENNKDWQPYSQEEELASFNATREISSEDNAATIYNKLLEGYDWRNNDLAPAFLDSQQERNTQNGFWKKKDYPKLAQWMEQHETLIESLMEATKKPVCYFPSTLNIANTDSMNRDSALRNWYQILIREGNNDVSEGDVNTALEKYHASIQIGHHFIQQPQSLSLLSALACYNRVLQRLNELVVTQKLNGVQLNEIEKIVTSISEDWHSIWPDVVKDECLKMKNFIAIDYEVNSKGRSRFRRNTENELADQIKEMLDIPIEYNEPPVWKTRLAKASTIFQWFYMPSTPEKAAAVIEEIFKDYHKMASPDYDWEIETDFSPWKIKLNFKYGMRMALMYNTESHTRTHDFFVEGMSRRCASLLLIGLKRYHIENGEWPDNLNQIKSYIASEAFHDPISDDAFMYKLEDGEFVLYSRGRNRLDDNGERTYRSREENGGADDRVFWPLPSRKKSKTKPPSTPWG